MERARGRRAGAKAATAGRAGAGGQAARQARCREAQGGDARRRAPARACSPAVERRSRQMAPAHRLPAPAGRELARSVGRGAARLARNLAGAVPRRGLAARSPGATRSRRSLEGAGAVGQAAHARPAGADPYRGAERLARAGRLCQPGRAHPVGAPAGDVRPHRHAAGRRRQGAADHPSAVAGAAAGAGDARPRELLGQRLPGGEGRTEGPLSAPLLAGRSAGRRADGAGAARGRAEGLRTKRPGVSSRRPGQYGTG